MTTAVHQLAISGLRCKQKLKGNGPVTRGTSYLCSVNTRFILKV